jgi:guanylate kinase
MKFLTHYVTREPRDGEIDGYHIKHISREHFEMMYDQGLIVTRTDYAGNLYGAPRSAILDIQVNKEPYHATATGESIDQFKKILGNDNVIVFYVKPPDIDILRYRMIKRGDSPESVEKRIAHIFSAAELENEKLADYVVVNDVLADAQTLVEDIIFKEFYLDKISK